MEELDLQISVDTENWPGEQELQVLSERVLGAAVHFLAESEAQLQAWRDKLRVMP